MNNLSTLPVLSTASKKGQPAAGIARRSHPSDAKASDSDPSGDKTLNTTETLASHLKPAIKRVIESGNTLAKDTATATREAAVHAKRLATQAVSSTEQYVSQKPKRSVAIAAVVGAAAATLVLTKRSRRSVLRFG